VQADGVEGCADATEYAGTRINGVDFYRMMRRFDGVVASVAAEKSAIFIDLAARDGWEDGDFYDFAHMTPQGARKVGTLLGQEMKLLYGIVGDDASIETQ
jgi:hypothetical protein